MNDDLVPYQRNPPPEKPEDILSRLLPGWETRGRGWSLFDFPVELEPTFCPIYHLLDVPKSPITDDGRRATFWSELLDGFKGKPAGGSSASSAAMTSYRQKVTEYQSFIAGAIEPVFCQYRNTDFIELQMVLPKDLKPAKSAAENLLTSFSYLSHPVSFEVIGCSEQIIVQFASSEKDLCQVRQQLESHLTGCFVKETTDYLSDIWINGESGRLIVDFGLSNEFMLPLKTASHFDTDLLVTVIGALSNLARGEVGVFQVLFQKTRNDWAQEILDSNRYFEQTGMLSSPAAEAARLAREKARAALFAACVRVAGRSSGEQRAWQIVKSLGAGLSILSNPIGNELIPLSNDDYPEEYHEQALLNRQSFRDGMILNLDELTSIVHPPSSAVRAAKLRREMEQTRAAPSLAIGHTLRLGENHHQNEVRQVSLSSDQRTKHIHVIGSSGSGKSTLLLGLIKQDLEAGVGVCVIDPHGDLIDEVTRNVPENRTDDVVLFDPSDAEFPIGFNILSANSELEKTLLSSDLVATFRRMSTSWGDVMDSVLANAILAFVESERGGTLFDLKRFLIEKAFRSDFLNTVRDEAIHYFWTNEFPLIAGKPQSSILIRLDAFLRQKLIRNIVCQKENKIDFRKIMDERKILLIKLSQGAIGEENSYLLGTLLVSKLYQTALSRQDTQNRPFFSCYLDEFHHFITPSMESVLSGVRKYNLGLVLAHQEFRQLQSRSQEVAASVLANCYTRICFRLGDADAEKFASGFSFFDARALQNLSVGEAVGRVERAEYDFNLKISRPSKISWQIAEKRRAEIINLSRERYAKPKAEVEAELNIARAVQTEQAAPLLVISELAEPLIPAARVQNTEEKSKGNIAENFTTQIKESENEISLKPPDSLPQKAFVPDKDTQGHRYLQSLVKRMAESKGFLVTIEKAVFGGAGKIDVALEREQLKIACEISVTNEAGYELQNIQKCLAAGYAPVVMISADLRHLDKIRQKAAENLTAKDFARINFLNPEEFHSLLETLETDSSQAAEKVKGFKVNVRLKPVDEANLSTRKRAISDIVFRGLKKLKNKLDDK